MVARRHSLPGLTARVSAALLVLLGFAPAGLRAQQPTGGTVVAGQATIATAPNLTTVTAGNNSVLVEEMEW